MPYLNRAEWKAAPPSTRLPMNKKPKGIVIHWVGVPVTGPAAITVRGIQRFHQETRGWYDIAYQELIDTNGNVYEGRGFRIESGANGSRKANKAYGAICLLIGPDQTPTPAMIHAVRNRVAAWRRVYPKATEIKAHRDVQPTQCPGADAAKLIRSGAFEPSQPAPNENESTNPESGYPIPARLLRRGSNGDDVRWVQSKLNKAGARLVVDGVYGPRTARAVRRFQLRRKLMADAIVGPITVSRLKAVN